MAASEANNRQAHSRREAEVDRIVATLRTYGALTRVQLAHLSGAARWSEPGFNQALVLAVSSGMVRRLGETHYEIAGPSREL